MKRLRVRFTYANVVATLALFIALAGGTAYAASQLGKETIGGRAIKKESIGPGKLTKAAKAALEGPAGPKGATGAMGPQGPKGEAAAVLWAVVNSDGTLARGKEVSTTHEKSSGEYQVEFFQHDVSQCNWQATIGDPGVFGTREGMISVALDAGDPESLTVDTTNKSGAPAAEPFHVAVFC